MTTQRNEALAVTALGMTTPLGRGAVMSCAAARAGILRLTELNSLDFGGEATFGAETIEGAPTVKGAIVRGIGDTFSGLARALMLGGPALDELLEARPLTDDERARTGFILNLSDHFLMDTAARAGGADVPLPSQAWRQATAELPKRLTAPRKLAPMPGQLVQHHGGNAGFVAALDDAAALLASNQVDRCIVGAIDSRAEASFLQASARLRLLRTADNPVGLTPGEAAAFLLVERPRDVVRAGRRAVATIAATAAGSSAAHLLSDDWPHSDGKLAQVLLQAMQARPPLGFAIIDLNGTPRRAVEWGDTLVRLVRHDGFAAAAKWFPAVSFGDTGAASGAVGICLAARAFARGYAPSHTGVVSLCSESGAKGVIVVQAPTN